MSPLLSLSTSDIIIIKRNYNYQKPIINYIKMAERVGFEPTEGSLLLRFSRPAPSTARPSLRVQRLILSVPGGLCQTAASGELLSHGDFDKNNEAW
jgi:hypothetical protein